MWTFCLWINSLDVDLMDDLLPHPSDHRLALVGGELNASFCQNCCCYCPNVLRAKSVLNRIFGGSFTAASVMEDLIHRQKCIDIDSIWVCLECVNHLWINQDFVAFSALLHSCKHGFV
jgi:hypothetical protein